MLTNSETSDVQKIKIIDEKTVLDRCNLMFIFLIKNKVRSSPFRMF
jgi:hypothetical protein